MSVLGQAPIGASAEFVRLVVEAKGADWAASWLNRQNCLFGEDLVVTTAYGLERLESVAHLAKRVGVRLQDGAHFSATPGGPAELAAHFRRQP